MEKSVNNAEYKKLKAELDKIEKELKGGAEPEEAAAVHAAAKEISEYLSRMSGLLAKMVKLSHGLLSISQGRIAIRGVQPCPYTVDTVTKAVAEHKQHITYCVKCMAENGITPRYAAELGKSLYTLYDIFDSEDELCEELCARAAKARKSQEGALTKRRDEILKKLDGLAKKQEEAAKAFKEQVGKLGISSLEYPKAFGQDLKIVLGVNEGARTLCSWDMNRGLLYVKGATPAASASVLKNAALRFLFAFPGGCAQILYCSNHTYDDVNSFLDMLSPADVFYGSKELRTGGVFRMQEMFESLNRLYNARTTLLNRNYSDSVMEYNANTPKDIQSPVLVILHDYPVGFDNCANLGYYFENGPKYGVYFLVIEGEVKRENYSSREEVPDAAPFADISLECNGNGSFAADGMEYCCNPVTRAETGGLVEKIKAAKDAANAIITYDDLGFGEERAEGRDVGKMLSFCVGKSKNKNYYLKLAADGNDGAPQFLILGDSGYGKSSLINSLIFCGSMKYSPQDLNFYLIDFKAAAGSSKFANVAAMPHIKMVAQKSRPEEAETIVLKIYEEYERRNALFNSLGCDSIVSYNELMDRQNKPHIPRAVVIIDEAADLFAGDSAGLENIIDNCQKIVNKGRSAGVHILFSVLYIESRMRRMSDLINGRCCFNTDPDKARDMLNSDAAAIIGECPKGTALVSHNKGQTVDKVKFGFVGDKDYEKYAKRIRERWSAYPINTAVVGESSRLNFKEAAKWPLYPQDAAPGAVVGQSYYSHEPVRLEFNDKRHSLMLVGNNAKVQTDYITSIVMYALKTGGEVKLVDASTLTESMPEYPLIGLFRGAPGVEVFKPDGYLKALAQVSAAADKMRGGADRQAKPLYFVVHGLQNTEFTNNTAMEQEAAPAKKQDGDDGYIDIFSMRRSVVSSRETQKSAVRGADTFFDLIKNSVRIPKFYIIFSVDDFGIFGRLTNDALQKVSYNIVHDEITEGVGSIVGSTRALKTYMEKDFCNEHLSLLFQHNVLTEKIRHISYDNDAQTKKLIRKEVKPTDEN